MLLMGGVAGVIFLNLHQAAQLPLGEAPSSIFEGDTWWHLAVGKRILATHRWPTADHYSFTAPGDPWIAYEWLGDAIIAAADRLGGLAGLTALLVVLAAGIELLMYCYAFTRTRNGKAAFLACVLLLPLTVLSLTLRPQLIGYIFLLITLICLERFRQGRQAALWILPVIFLFWVNTHGSFVFGLAALGLYWASGLVHFKAASVRAEPWTPQQQRHLEIVALLSSVALVITPYGTQLAANPLEMAFLQPINIASFQEWRSPDFGAGPGKLLLVMVLLFLLSPLITKVEYRLEEVCLLLFGVYAAFLHMRFIILFTFISAPFLASMMLRYLPRYEASKDKYRLNAVLMLLVMAGGVCFFPSRATLRRVVRNRFPQAAVEYIEQHPFSGPFFNNEFWGGYMIMKLGPQQKVFIDGRADLYEAAGVLSDYLDITRPSGNALFLLRKYHVKSCLIQPNTPLAVLLAHLPEWRQVYSDKLSVVFSRQSEHGLSRDGNSVPKSEKQI